MQADASISPRQPGPGRPTGQVRACSLLRRLLVMVYDAVIVLGLLILAAAAALALRTGDLTAGKDPLYTIYLAGVWFLYLSWCWRHAGMTVGMRAWRVRIESDGGGIPTWGQCSARFGVAVLSASAAGLGFLWALFDPQRRCWHDLASRTRLVHVPSD